MEGWVGLSTMSVNNLLKVITQQRSWRDSNLWVTSPRPYHYATKFDCILSLFYCRENAMKSNNVCSFIAGCIVSCPGWSLAGIIMILMACKPGRCKHSFYSLRVSLFKTFCSPLSQFVTLFRSFCPIYLRPQLTVLIGAFFLYSYCLLIRFCYGLIALMLQVIFIYFAIFST